MLYYYLVMTEKKLRRGVKEVIKAIRKKETGIVILAGDISPIDVLSHIPIQCENKDIPYIYVRSRMELGTVIHLFFVFVIENYLIKAA